LADGVVLPNGRLNQENFLIDVILADNTRSACGGPPLIRYSAGGVILALAKKGLDVRCVDLMSDMEGNLSAVPAQDPADVCCYAVFFGNKVNAFRHMEDARRAKKAPRLIIAFGPFASVFPNEILSRGLADIVVATDPEFVIPAVLQGDASPWETIPNLSYMHEGKIFHTPKHSFHDLDEIPFISPYLYSQGHRPAFTMTARGCQYHCVFCDRNVIWGGGVRNRSVANVLEEVKELVETHHVPNIRLYDEDLAADHKRLALICEGMRRIKGEFYWSCSACVDSVNQKMLLLMGLSRCRGIYFGVESASPQVLRRIGKTYGREEILNAVRWSQEAGLKPEVMITIGNPGETDIDRNLTLSALKELGPDVNVITNRIVILPGTAFYRKGLREGWFTQQSFFEDEGLVFYDEKERM
jgi:anaerobic magnesium-protoporphyrin IX monomethyl ester cyclase